MLILGVDRGKTYLEVTETRRKIYIEDNIKKVLDCLPTRYKLCFVYGDKMTLLFPHEINFQMGRAYFSTNKIVLRNVKKNFKNELYKYLLSKVDSYTAFIKIGNVNVVRMMALTLASCTILGAYSGVVKLTKSSSKETPEVSEIVTKTDSNNKVYNDLVYNATEENSDSVYNVPEENSNSVYNVPKENSNFTLETNRITDDTIFKSSIPVGARLDNYATNLIKNFKKSDNFKIVDYCSKAYDFDCDLFLALLTNETGLDHTNTISGGSRFNGSGNGISQIEETNIGKTFTTYNHITKQMDSITVTKENVLDYETNVKIGAIIFKNCLDRYYGNIYLSLQAYNYGDKMMHTILTHYAVITGLTIEQICNNYDDLGWMKFIIDAHNNPKNYQPDWKYNTYGTANYIEKVLGYYTGDNITYEKNAMINNDETINYSK